VGRRLILGTNVLIAYERGTIDWATLGTDELAVAALSSAEYRVGIEFADTPVRAAHRTRALAAITSAVDALTTPRQPAEPIVSALGHELPGCEVQISAVSLVIQRGPERHWDWDPMATARFGTTT
jgi:hypothetical protein